MVIIPRTISIPLRGRQEGSSLVRRRSHKEDDDSLKPLTMRAAHTLLEELEHILKHLGSCEPRTNILITTAHIDSSIQQVDPLTDLKI